MILQQLLNFSIVFYLIVVGWRSICKYNCKLHARIDIPSNFGEFLRPRKVNELGHCSVRLMLLNLRTNS